MVKNCKQALQEHASFLYPFYKGVFVPKNQIFLSTTPVDLECVVLGKEEQGRRYQMEDAHFFQENEKGILLGVFDGHNGIEVARYACYRFQELFFSILEDDVSKAFFTVFATIQEEIENKHSEWESIGSTAVVSYIEKATNYVYTATLGDSEANIYRKIGKKRKSLPLSCIRNWGTKRDAYSAKLALGEAIPFKKNSKEMRHPPPGISVHSGSGLNVSRALGDVLFKGVIHSPKITLTTLLPGDILLLACDGLKDFVTEKEILKIIEIHQGRYSLVEDLIDYAISVNHSTDNVTILGIFIS